MKKRMQFLLTWFGIVASMSMAFAQERPADRVTAPFSDPSRAGQLKASLISGSITVKGYAGKEVVVEARARTDGDFEEEKSGGMKRLVITSTGLTVEEEDNVMSVGAASHTRSIDLTIQVPVKTSLKVSTVNNGHISIENVQGEVEANNVNGGIKITDVSGTVLANTTNGDVTVTFAKVAPDNPMSFVSFNGDVDVTLPANIKANVKMKSEQGEIYSDFDIKLDERSRLIKEDARDKGGRYRVRVESAMYGTINGGGPEYYFSTFNGTIYIRKTK